MALVTTTSGARLNSDAAASYEDLNRAFIARFGKRLAINSGARTYEEQVKAFKDNHQLTPILNNGKYITRNWNGQTWYLKPGKATVAQPGTSNHEYPPGRAADFGSGVQTLGSVEHNWMRANAGRYGWEWTGEDFVTVEPWHWEKTGSYGGGGTAPQEDVMNAEQEKKLDAVLQALGAGGLVPGMWPDSIMGNSRKALERLDEIRGRVVNLDQQLTGADGQAVNLVQHVLDIKKIVQAGGVTEEQANAIADAVAEKVGVSPAELAKAVNDDHARRMAN